MSRTWHIVVSWLKRANACPIVPGMTVIHRCRAVDPAVSDEAAA
ncbi:hypothetical protein OM076_07520 [Solirubrobacter ginsenosidimutans]|uniref:Uncharacterized protein n=1 Tax=Solirubrobacter ginsenosidimutans TaxID=490573 RepID=A0A9X3MQP0_9ACTN|nr:hypothetical protein [Solirubrobacter ginsenosidimutans]MDA0160106.1 hypothetical protein [Solirubrobacter ginsenosidimutans]